MHDNNKSGLSSDYSEEVGVPITDCALVSEIPQSECQALMTFYESTAGTNWFTKTNWLETDTPCSWFGITCTDDHVEILQLPDNNLNGSIPPELGNLTELRILDLEINPLTGTIPSEIGNLTKLEWLNSHTTLLAGSLPEEIGELDNLQTLRLYSNQLTDTIPSELGNLVNLKELWLNENPLDGCLPESLTNLKMMQNFQFQATNLEEPTTKEWAVNKLCNVPGMFPRMDSTTA